MKRPFQRVRRIRRGYALLVCLMVAAVCSIAVIGIFQTARYETLEVTAKKQASIADWSARAGSERAVALLLDNPSLRGALPPFTLPGPSAATVTSQIQQAGQQITVQTTAVVQGLSRTHSSSFSVSELQKRIDATGK